jgi:hypothetical protein
VSGAAKARNLLKVGFLQGDLPLVSRDEPVVSSAKYTEDKGKSARPASIQESALALRCCTHVAVQD